MAMVASRGNSAKIGITARSWKSRTEKTDRPDVVFICPVSRKVCNTMAVDERASARPTAIACCHGRTMAAAPPITRLVRTTWAPPTPNMGVRICQSSDGLSSRPTKKSIMTTPNSVKCITSSTSPISDSPKGPMTMPAIR